MLSRVPRHLNDAFTQALTFASENPDLRVEQVEVEHLRDRLVGR